MSHGVLDLPAAYGMVQQRHPVVFLEQWVGGNNDLMSGAVIENLPGRIASRSKNVKKA